MTDEGIAPQTENAAQGNLIADSCSAQPWHTANEYLDHLRPFSNLFSRCVRSLQNDLAKMSNGELSECSTTRFFQLYRSNAVKAVMYHAALTFHKEKVVEDAELPPKSIVSLFGPQQLSIMLTLVFLTRRIRKKADPKEYERLAASLNTYVDLGMYLGMAIPEIGPATAMTVGGLRHIAFGTFLVAKPAEYRKYRLSLKQRELAYDRELEQKTFGCTHVHIASRLLQLFGFGIESATGLEQGLSDQPHHNLMKTALSFRVADIWLSSLALRGAPPEGALGDEYAVDSKVYDSIESQLVKVIAQGSTHQWLSKSKNDSTAM